MLARHHDGVSPLARTLEQRLKARFSFVAYAAAIALAFVYEWLTIVIYFGVAAMWLLPDKHLEAAAEE